MRNHLVVYISALLFLTTLFFLKFDSRPSNVWTIEELSYTSTNERSPEDISDILLWGQRLMNSDTSGIVKTVYRLVDWK